MSVNEKILPALYELILSRKDADPESSYTAGLLTKGTQKCVEKFGEEAVETIAAASRGERQEVIRESADMLYHWLVMLVSQNIALQDVLDELERRQGISGLEEKRSRKSGEPPGG